VYSSLQKSGASNAAQLFLIIRASQLDVDLFIVETFLGKFVEMGSVIQLNKPEPHVFQEHYLCDLLLGDPATAKRNVVMFEPPNKAGGVFVSNVIVEYPDFSQCGDRISNYLGLPGNETVLQIQIVCADGSHFRG
jgi:hypothetical protein